MVEFYDPGMYLSQGCEREPFQVNGLCMAKVLAGGFGDGACELGTTDSSDPFRFQGNGAGNLRVSSEFCTVPCGRVGCNYEGVILLIPGIEA